MDNLNTPDNMSKNTHTKLFKSQFSGASGNNIYWLASARKSLETKSFQVLYACIKLNGLEAVAFKPLFFCVDYLITDLIPIPF